MCAYGRTALALVAALALSLFWSAASTFVVILGLAHIVTPVAPPPRRSMSDAKIRPHRPGRMSRHAHSRTLSADSAVSNSTKAASLFSPGMTDEPLPVLSHEAVPQPPSSPRRPISPGTPHSSLPIPVEAAVPLSAQPRSSSLVSSSSNLEISPNKIRPRSWNPGERFSPPRPSPLRRIISLDGHSSAPTTSHGRPLSPVPSSRSTSPVQPSTPKISTPLRRRTAPPSTRRVPKDRHTISAEIARAAWGDEWELS